MSERVVVVGSGIAGLSAALAAAEAGRRVTVVEKGPLLGGTSALSGGVAWLPGNRFAADDSAEDAIEYLGALGLGDVDAELISVFVHDAARVADWIEAVTPLSWRPIPYPDYHPGSPGARTAGRALEPDPLAVDPEVTARLLRSPHLRVPVTYGEGMTGALDAAEVRRRVEAGMVTMGRGLLSAMLVRLDELGVDVLAGTAVDRLRTEDGAVRGVACGAQHHRGRVVLATGGFERDPALVRAFLKGPLDAPTGAGGLTGDGLRMAMSVGAELGNMSEAWWVPAMAVPGEEIGGAPLHRLLLTERAAPGSLMVDRTGRRFTNETQNYNDLGREMAAFDAATFSHHRLPAWLIVDAGFRRRYPLGPLRPDGADPDWLVRADDLGALADRIGVPADALVGTVERFNAAAVEGRDPDHHRGESAYDQMIGDASAPHPNLGPLTDPPFYAVEVRLGCLATKGGPRTDGRGRVLGVGGERIDGLYAVGNAAASPFGYAYPGAGGTIGPALVFGVRAGEAAATDDG